jgi:imidazolonepropionase-like amidohydrolase
MLSAAHGATQSVVIENGVLIDGNGGTPVAGSVVIVDGNKIAAVGTKGQVQYPRGAKVIDASGKYVLPGFIDAHVHYYNWLGELYLNHGITTVYDFSNNLPEFTLAQKIGIEKGKIVGPRIYLVGKALATETTQRATAARNPEEVREIITHAVSLGADGIKVHTPNLRADLLKVAVEESHKRGLPIGIHVEEDPEAMTARQAVDIGVDMLVHSGGMAISMIPDPATRKRFLQEQFPIGEGGGDPWYLIKPVDMDEFVRLLVSKNVSWNPTGTSVWRSINPLQPSFAEEIDALFSDPRLSYIPPTSQYEPTRPPISYLTQWQDAGWAAYPRIEMFTPAERERHRKNFEQYQIFVKKFVDAGGTIIPGSDPVGSGVPGIGLHHEMQMLVAAGIPAMRVLSFATKSSAEYIRHGKELGTIEPGKLADIVILKQDPVADIRNTKSIDTVMKGGEIVPLGYHPTYYTPFPRPIEILTARSSTQSLTFQLSPRYVTEGASNLELTLTSRDRFWKSATVYINDVPVETQWAAPGELRAKVPSAVIDRPGVYRIRINYPGPTGGFSPPASLIVGYK